MSAQRTEILRRYANGAELASISKDLQIKHEDVVEVVSSLGFTRSRAANELRKLDTGIKLQPPASISLPPRVEVSRKPTQEQPVAEPDILTRAAALGGRFATKAGKIRHAIADLAAEIEANAEVIEAAKKVDDLKAELDRATAALKALKPTKTAATPRENGYDPRVVRAWAQANDVACPKAGRFLPADVVKAWREATDG